jgi:hypothetical protein
MKNLSLKKWGTADGKVIPIESITHQHLSNIYWYHSVFQDLPGMSIKILKDIVCFSQNELEKRFEGSILEWRPIYDYEINWLKELGMLTGGTIITDKLGNKIGNILTEPIISVKLN